MDQVKLTASEARKNKYVKFSYGFIPVSKLTIKFYDTLLFIRDFKV